MTSGDLAITTSSSVIMTLGLERPPSSADDQPFTGVLTVVRHKGA